MTQEEAGQQYLDLVQPINDMIDATSDPWNIAFNASDWQKMSALASESIEAERAFLDSIIAASWPDDIQPLIDKMISQEAADMAWYSGLSNATSEDEFWSAYGSGGSFDRSAAQEIRMRLGLDNID